MPLLPFHDTDPSRTARPRTRSVTVQVHLRGEQNTAELTPLFPHREDCVGAVVALQLEAHALPCEVREGLRPNMTGHMSFETGNCWERHDHATVPQVLAALAVHSKVHTQNSTINAKEHSARVPRLPVSFEETHDTTFCVVKRRRADHWAARRPPSDTDGESSSSPSFRVQGRVRQPSHGLRGVAQTDDSEVSHMCTARFDVSQQRREHHLPHTALQHSVRQVHKGDVLLGVRSRVERAVRGTNGVPLVRGWSPHVRPCCVGAVDQPPRLIDGRHNEGRVAARKRQRRRDDQLIERGVNAPIVLMKALKLKLIFATECSKPRWWGGYGTKNATRPVHF
eukprot:PhM_4_TR2047/c2_g3_i3/m.46073